MLRAHGLGCGQQVGRRRGQSPEPSCHQEQEVETTIKASEPSTSGPWTAAQAPGLPGGLPGTPSDLSTQETSGGGSTCPGVFLLPLANVLHPLPAQGALLAARVPQGLCLFPLEVPFFTRLLSTF